MKETSLETTQKNRAKAPATSSSTSEAALLLALLLIVLVFWAAMLLLCLLQPSIARLATRSRMILVQRGFQEPVFGNFLLIATLQVRSGSLP